MIRDLLTNRTGAAMAALTLSATGLLASAPAVASALPPSAQPGSVSTYVRSAVGTGNFAGATAACAPGDVAISGGATHSAGTRPTALLASRPDGTPATGWHARYNGGDASTQITAFVVCAPAGFSTYVRSAVGTGNFAGATAACAPGDVAIGGGATHSAGTRPTALLASRPDGTPATGWHARYNGGDASTQITAFAICADVS